MSYNGPALAPLNPGVILEAVQRDPVGMLLPLALSTGLFVAVLRAARRAGRPPKLAGWMLGPVLGVMLASVLSFHRLLQALEFARCAGNTWVCAQKLWVYHQELIYLPAPMASALAWGGLLLGGASLSRLGRPQGLRLGLLGGLLLALAGAVEGHRAMLGAWSLGQWTHSEANRALSWQLVQDSHLLRVSMLRYAGLLAALLLPVGLGPRAGRRQALGLALGLLAALLLAVWGMHGAMSARGWLDPDPWGPPVELARPWDGDYVPDKDTPPPFPARAWGVGVIEARYLERP